MKISIKRYEQGRMRRNCIINNSNNMNRDTNIVFNHVRATALISLNYKYGPTGRLGVNAAIRPHSTVGTFHVTPHSEWLRSTPKVSA